jgi:hypothetical protein
MWASGFQAPKPQPEEGGPSYLLAECWGRFSFRGWHFADRSIAGFNLGRD